MQGTKLVLSLAVASGLFVAVADNADASRRSYCDAYARDVADSRAGPGAADVLAGAAVGAATGAIIGGIIDKGEGAGKGAIIGGVGGTVLGAGSSSGKWRRHYERAYANCMAQYDDEPEVVYYRKAPRPGTEAWYDYCAAKYRSFNPDTGMYKSTSGKWKKCR